MNGIVLRMMLAAIGLCVVAGQLMALKGLRAIKQILLKLRARAEPSTYVLPEFDKEEALKATRQMTFRSYHHRNG